VNSVKANEAQGKEHEESLDRIFWIDWIFCFLSFLKKLRNSNLPLAEGHFVA
jgi:hypothetical protein